MTLTPRAALLNVERATKARQRSDVDAGEALERQGNAIRAAINAGASVADISAVTGLTPARIYQIRDGRR